MKPATVETWVWVLVYGGLLALVLGLDTLRSDAALGWPLVAGGGVVAALGAALIVVRARMRD